MYVAAWKNPLIVFCLKLQSIRIDPDIWCTSPLCRTWTWPGSTELIHLLPAHLAGLLSLLDILHTFHHIYPGPGPTLPTSLKFILISPLDTTLLLMLQPPPGRQTTTSWTRQTSSPGPASCYSGPSQDFIGGCSQVLIQFLVIVFLHWQQMIERSEFNQTFPPCN